MNERMLRLSAMVILLSIMGLLVGCFTAATARTTKTMPDGTVTESYVRVMGTGDKVSQMAAEGLFADGTDEDLGAGVKKASASQQSTGIDGTLNGLGQLMTGMAKFMAATQGGRVPGVPALPPAASQDESADVADTSVAPDGIIAAKAAEAKAAGKPLVVIAGNTGCGYCSTLDAKISADKTFLARTDIVLYRETSPWSSNQAAKWTGGGKFPVMRITEWDSAGNVTCDKTVNRPQSIADIDAALGSCVAPK